MDEKNIIVEYIEDWLETEKRYLDAGDTDSLRRFMKGLGEKMDKLSIVPQNRGTKLILYGGKNGEVDMWQIAKGASKTGQDYYYISDTEAGDLLNNDDVWDKMGEVCDNDDLLRDRIYGNDINGVRQAYVIDDCLAINDHVSKRLAEAASGDVTVWAPDCELYKVLPQTELRAILLNENVTSINGIPKQHFKDVYCSHAGITDFLFDSPEKLSQQSVNAVYEEIRTSCVKEKFDDVKVYYNNEGKIIGTDVTDIVGGQYDVPKKTEFTNTVKDTREFATDVDMSAKYKDYNGLNGLDKIKAKQAGLDLPRLQNEFNRQGIKPISDQFADEIGGSQVFKQTVTDRYAEVLNRQTDTVQDLLRKSEDIHAMQKSGYFDRAVMQMDADGNYVRMDLSKITGENYIKHEAAAYEAELGDIRQFAKEGDMSAKYEEYDSLNPVGKMEVKQTDLETRRLELELNGVQVSDDVIYRYLTASHKSLDQLSDLDHFLLKVAEGINSKNNAITRGLSEIKNMSGIGERSVRLGKVVGVVGTAYDLFSTYSTAKQYYDNGEYGNAVRTVSIKVAEESGRIF